MDEKNIDFFPVKFKKVSKHFTCIGNGLTSLLGAPDSVGENFCCDSNQLSTLEFAPKKVGGDFFCCNNDLISLRFSPQSIGGNFDCSANNLRSLEFCPKEIVGSFYFYSNFIENLEHFPQNVGKFVFCPQNVALGELQSITDFKSLLEVHQSLVQIRKEKKCLANALGVAQKEDKKIHKI